MLTIPPYDGAPSRERCAHLPMGPRRQSSRSDLIVHGDTNVADADIAVTLENENSLGGDCCSTTLLVREKWLRFSAFAVRARHCGEDPFSKRRNRNPRRGSNQPRDEGQLHDLWLVFEAPATPKTIAAVQSSLGVELAHAAVHCRAELE